MAHRGRSEDHTRVLQETRRSYTGIGIIGLIEKHAREGQCTVALPSPNPAAVDTISKATGFAVYPVFSNPADLEAKRRRLAAA
jgi:hypothetical protein